MTKTNIVDFNAVQAQFDLPNTPVIVRTFAYAREKIEDDVLFTHVVRSWIFSERIAAKQGIAHDTEVLGVSTLLHDIGLTDNAGTTHRFEVEGAIAARNYVQELNFDNHRSQLVWDSISLHTTPSISLLKEPEVSLCTRGVGLDFGSPDYQLFKQEEIDAIVVAAPRMNLKKKFIACFCHLAETRPETTYASIVRDFGERFVKGYKPPSTVDALEGGPYSE